MRLGIVTGLRLEARCIRRLPAGSAVRVAGSRRGAAGMAAAALAASGADLLVSFGLAAGLDPDLVPGDLVLADRVIAPDGAAHITDRAGREIVAADLKGRIGIALGPVSGSDSPVATAAAKADRRAATGAAALDMESHEVAVAAAAAGLPFIVVRAIGDSATETVPPAALAGFGDDGTTRTGAVLLALMRRPGDLSALMHLARRTAQARRTLRAAGQALVGLAGRPANPVVD